MINPEAIEQLERQMEFARVFAKITGRSVQVGYGENSPIQDENVIALDELMRGGGKTYEDRLSFIASFREWRKLLSSQGKEL